MKRYSTLDGAPMKNYIDLTGQRFGCWTVVERGSHIAYGTKWKCRCDCGTEREVLGVTLRNGNSKSCGCRRRENCKTASVVSPLGLGYGKSITADPSPWKDDGGVKRVPVYDHNWLIDGKPRLVRQVGWRHCMTGKHTFLSPDIAKVRICSRCKILHGVKHDVSMSKKQNERDELIVSV